jgi:hypothetical protein
LILKASAPATKTRLPWVSKRSTAWPPWAGGIGQEIDHAALIPLGTVLQSVLGTGLRHPTSLHLAGKNDFAQLGFSWWAEQPYSPA